MARGLQNYPNTDGTDLVNFPARRVRDNNGTGNGTPINEYTTGDLHQFLAKLLRAASITANGLAESEGNGHQYYEAIAKLSAQGFPGNAGGAWINAGTSTGITVQSGSGSVTIDAADVVYNRYRFNGYTLDWQLQIRQGTVTGTVDVLTLPLPFSGWKFANQRMLLTGFTNTSLMVVTTGFNAALDPNDVRWVGLAPASGSFATSTDNSFIYMGIVAELMPV